MRSCIFIIRWWKVPVSSLQLDAPLTVNPNVTIQETLSLLNREGYDQVPVVGELGHVEGMVTVGHMMSQVMKGHARASDAVSKVIYTQFKQVDIELLDCG